MHNMFIAMNHNAQSCSLNCRKFTMLFLMLAVAVYILFGGLLLTITDPGKDATLYDVQTLLDNITHNWTLTSVTKEDADAALQTLATTLAHCLDRNSFHSSSASITVAAKFWNNVVKSALMITTLNFCQHHLYSSYRIVIALVYAPIGITLFVTALAVSSYQLGNILHEKLVSSLTRLKNQNSLVYENNNNQNHHATNPNTAGLSISHAATMAAMWLALSIPLLCIAWFLRQNVVDMLGCIQLPAVVSGLAIAPSLFQRISPKMQQSEHKKTKLASTNSSSHVHQNGVQRRRFPSKLKRASTLKLIRTWTERQTSKAQAPKKISCGNLAVGLVGKRWEFMDLDTIDLLLIRPQNNEQLPCTSAVAVGATSVDAATTDTTSEHQFHTPPTEVKWE